MMHRVRDGEALPIPKPSRTVDIVIVGGGLSGLTSAYELRHENILLLEREESLGGNAKQGSFQGIPYALGSAYLVDTDEPYGSLYDDLGLTLTPVSAPTDSGFLAGQWQPLESGPVAKDFLRLQKQLKQFLMNPDFPSAPIQQASQAALTLDRLSFYDYLKTDYSPELLKVVDAYCYSALGGSIREISAYAGVNFYSEIAGPIYAFPGGNAVVAQRLIQQINKAGAGRLETGVSVYTIRQQDGQVLTTFMRQAHPETYETVASRAVILAVPYFFGARVLQGLPPAQHQLMQSMRYGAYLVANCCFNRQVVQGGYDNWTPYNPTFTDFIDADFVSGTSRPENRASVLTVYAPFRNPGLGRATLLQGDKASLARHIEESLRHAIDFPKGSLEEVRLTRYGHQILTSRVGLIQALSGMEKVLGRVVLAHSDGQGMAAIESAISEGLAAAQTVKSRLLI